MKTALRYIELKSGFDHNGPAWIALVTFSKLGKTVYFNGKSLKKLQRAGGWGNYYDLETQAIY